MLENIDAITQGLSPGNLYVIGGILRWETFLF